MTADDRHELKYAGIIEARMTSSRLSGKMMKLIGGKPSIEILVKRLQQVSGLNQVIVATTVNVADNPLNDFCNQFGIGCFRGSEEDVLGRVLGAARMFGVDVIVEVTGDSTFIDPELTQELIDAYKQSDADFVANCVERPFLPPGMGARIFSMEALGEVDRITQDLDDREHVSLHFWEHPDKYKLLHLKPPPELVSFDQHIALDGPGDLEMLRHIYDALEPQNHFFTAREIIEFLHDHPDVAKLSRKVKRKGTHNEQK